MIALDLETVEAIAERVAELLRETSPARDSSELIDAAEAARRLGVTRSTVYELADELGAQRIGSGSKPRLRFDPDRVAAYGRSESARPAPARTTRRRLSPACAVELLPIRPTPDRNGEP